jgi:Na+/melibiose symporter-like transporter
MGLPIAMAGIPLYIHAPDFYINNQGLSLALIGTILLVLRFVDAALDPIIGILSDKFSEHKKEIFLLGVFLLGYGFFLVFNPTGKFKATWFAGSIFLATTGFSIISINLNAFGGVWSNDYNEKTRISAFREGFGLIGLIIAVILPTIIANFDKQNTFKLFSIIMVFILFLATLLFCFYWLYKFKTEVQNKPIKFSFFQVISSLKSKRVFYSIYFISMFSSSFPAVLVLFFIRDKLQLEQYTGLFLMVYFLLAASSMVLWNKISKKFGKIKAWGFAMILGVITFIGAFFLGAENFYPYLIICALSGIAFGAELVLPPAILADNLSKNNYTTDYSIIAFLSKAALAIATGFALPLLDFNGFATTTNNSSHALFTLSFLYALLPCVIKIVSATLLFKVLINQEKNEKNNFNNNGGFNA